ncbi:MAG: NCS2 family permease [Acidaminococcaceae bacterium]|nr:NCS2 family permease [Acidaminococcaceae bacterium]
MKERDTDWRREVVGGIAAFVTMAYIIFVNPQIMLAAGMDPGTVMLATCLASAAGTLLMGLHANAPFGLAPGMGINAFFAYTLCGTMGYTWEQGLGAVLLSGIIFVVVSVTGLRSRIIAEIPLHLKSYRRWHRPVYFIHWFEKCFAACFYGRSGQLCAVGRRHET